MLKARTPQVDIWSKIRRYESRSAAKKIRPVCASSMASMGPYGTLLDQIVSAKARLLMQHFDR
jgi:hypothetical protein